MNEQFTKSEQIDQLALALAGFQSEVAAVPFNSVNPFLHNKYADLGSVIETAKPILAKHGLMVTQPVCGDGQTVGVTTILMHKSGQYISSSMSLPTSDEKGKSLAQVAGSIVTYIRRYSLASVLGMYADEDSDGNPSQQKHTQPSESGTKNPPNPGATILPFKKAKELTGKEKPTLQDIADVGKEGLSYLNYIAGWEDAKPETKNAINEFLKVKPIVDEPHWSDDDGKRNAFFASLKNIKINDKELTIEQIHEALGVKHLKEFSGSGKDAFVKVRDWALK